MDQMLELKKERYVPPYNIALLLAGLGQTGAALEWLEQAFADREHMPFLLEMNGEKYIGLDAHSETHPAASRRPWKDLRASSVKRYVSNKRSKCVLLRVR